MKVLNYEQPENQSYRVEFQLAAASVVIAKVRGEQVIRWENLADVWTLVQDKPAFLDYIISEIKTLQESE